MPNMEEPYYLSKLLKIEKFICIDLETSGLDSYRNEILTVSVSLCNKHGEIDSIELNFKPESQFWDDDAEKIHCISRFQASKFNEKILSSKQLIEFINQDKDLKIIVCHALKTSSYFDWKFLQAHFDKYDRRHTLYKSIVQCQSTITWFKYLDRIGYDKNSEFNLKHLSAKYGIELEHHNAASDRIACQKLFFIALEALKNIPKEEDNGLFLTELFN